VDLTKLGFEEENLKDFIDALDKPYGMILVTGPTGSGKQNHTLFGIKLPEQNRSEYIDS
jgi:type II secretory ATPase GspE/PulE/Tfp pilus assembly ATPase PilB-like protein